MAATLDDVMATLHAIEAKIDALANARPMGGAHAAPSTPGGGSVADDADLDSKWGDPEIRKDPPRWTGASYAGRRYSECPADYLDSLAGFLDWKAKKDDEKGTDDGKKYAAYARKDAARARGWAKRNANKPAPGPVDAGGFGPDDSLPF